MNEAGVIYRADEDTPEEDIQRLKRMKKYDASIATSLAALEEESDKDRIERQLAELNAGKQEAVDNFLNGRDNE
jgi:hypothetical protein